jgi:hypothetical protein
MRRRETWRKKMSIGKKKSWMDFFPSSSNRFLPTQKKPSSRTELPDGIFSNQKSQFG